MADKEPPGTPEEQMGKGTGESFYGERAGALAAGAAAAAAGMLARMTGSLFGPRARENAWARHLVILHGIAPVPPMIAALVGHCKSVALAARDNGFCATFQCDADNATQNLLALLELWPSWVLPRALVLAGEAALAAPYALAYVLAPGVCHAAMAGLEAATVSTLTAALADLDAGRLPAWDPAPAPAPARKYWRLPGHADMRDVLLAMRADAVARSHNNWRASFGEPSPTVSARNLDAARAALRSGPPCALARVGGCRAIAGFVGLVYAMQVMVAGP
ncbi:hypothetical protein WJX81_007204 [Elliptochloris bilobata]|uniref:Ubiquinol oxidase n=1 Tax=Elliptochloris bilobata TaxID=381761 RepID=A0AAW1S451_9CHLO